jgi:hypothetical protein
MNKWMVGGVLLTLRWRRSRWRRGRVRCWRQRVDRDLGHWLGRVVHCDDDADNSLKAEHKRKAGRRRVI